MEIVVTEAQSGGHISAATTDVIVIRLPENSTTGYRWQVDTALGRVPMGDDFVMGPSAPGAGGERIVRFAAQAQGAAHVEMTLRRSWETGTEPQARFSVTVDVR